MAKILKGRVCWCDCWMDCGRWSSTSVNKFCLVMAHLLIVYTVTQCCRVNRAMQHFFDASGWAQGIGHSTSHHNLYSRWGGCWRTPQAAQADMEVSQSFLFCTNQLNFSSDVHGFDFRNDGSLDNSESHTIHGGNHALDPGDLQGDNWQHQTHVEA